MDSFDQLIELAHEAREEEQKSKPMKIKKHRPKN